MSTSNEAISRINELRQRIIRGEALSVEEAREAISLLRQQRAAATAPKESTPSDIPLDLNELFNKKEEEK